MYPLKNKLIALFLLGTLSLFYSSAYCSAYLCPLLGVLNPLSDDSTKVSCLGNTSDKVLVAQINVTGNGNPIANGSTSFSTTNFTEFGTVATCATFTRTFRISASGSPDLTVTNPITISGTHAAQFTVTTAPASTITSGSNSDFVVTFSPTSAGLKSATISIANNSGSDNPYVFNIQGTGDGPEAEVSGNSVAIVDGDPTPSLTDHTDFGNQSVCSGTVTRTFTIANSGPVVLNVGTVTVTGAGFTLGTAPASTVPITSGTTTFTVIFNPTVLGSSSGTVSIALPNECNENPYNFSIQGIGIDPEANVLGNSTTIADEDASPALADHTDFGSQNVCTGSVTRTFTIQNTGNTTDLTVGAVTVTGTGFALGVAPSSPVTTGTSTTFTVVFDPSATGLSNGTVSVAMSNECDENPYNFSIRGTGIDPEANVQGNSTTIADEDASPALADHTDFGSQSVCTGTVTRTFTIQNTGNTTALTVGTVTVTGTGFTLGVAPSGSVAAGASTTFTVVFDPTALGLSSGSVSIVMSNECDENPYNFSIQGTGVDPEANIRGNSTDIPDGDVTPILGDHTDFGTQAVCAGTVIRTFTIQNTGTAVLNVGTVTVTGTGFTLGTGPAATVAAASSTTFTVVFDPAAATLLTGTVSVALSNECDENPYNFSIQGTGADPEINVRGNAVSITDGDATPTTADHSDFTTQAVCAGSFSRTFTIENLGTATLTIGALTFTGGEASEFSVTTNPSATIAPSGSTTFVVAFNPSFSGVRSATLSIINGDCDENPYNFAIQGTGTDPEANVLGNAVSITIGDNTPSVTDHTDFGTGAACSAFIDRTYTVQNTGNSPMNVDTVTVTPSTEFVVVNQPAPSIAAGGSSNFTVRYTPASSPGTDSALVTVMTDDCDEINYRWNVKGQTTTETTPPSAICQDITTYLDATGSVTVPGSVLNFGSSDNCTDSLLLLFSSAGTYDCSNVSTAVLVTVTVQDAAGNLDSCAAKAVTVRDTIAPTVSCKNKTVYLSAATGAGQASIVAADIENASFDACGIDTKVAGQTLFTCANVDTNLVTLTITDVNGNDRTCTASVIVVDTVSPDPGCLNISVNLNASGFFEITPAMLNGGSTDNCTLAPLFVSNDTMRCTELGTYIDTLHVPDVNGNSSSCNATITVSDLLAPTAICQNRTVHLDAGGQYNLVASHMDNSSTDNCILGTMTVSKTNFTCANIGTNNVVLTVPDISGNSSTCSAVVTVVDSVKPVARCQNRIVLLGPSGTTTILPTLVDTSSTDACGITIRTLSDSTFTCADAGVNPTILTVTDGSGNSDTCTALVFIQDTGTPNAGCVANDTVYLDINGQDTITLADLNVGSVMLVDWIRFISRKLYFPVLI